MYKNVNKIWITWETQRRSIELARILNCKLFIIEIEGLFRYPVSIFKTIWIIFTSNPDFVFVQNPSMVLAFLACIVCKVIKKPVIVDRHTTFLLDKPVIQNFKRRLFLALSSFTIKHASVTIVTNRSLGLIVTKNRGVPVVMPDPLPEFKQTKIIQFKSKWNVLVPSTFASDEPILQIIEAAKELESKDVSLHITGNWKKRASHLIDTLPGNVMFTGFLPNQEYINLLFSVDIVMPHTTATSCMLCGCYEAVAAEKPLITSNKPALVEYFTIAKFVDNTAKGIVDGILEKIDNISDAKLKSIDFKKELNRKWQQYKIELENKMNAL